MNELKQPLTELTKDQKHDQSVNSSCCYFDIYCGELCYYICAGFCCLLGGVSI
jgi:hypothetical protein